MDIGEREEVGIWCSEDSLQVGPQMTRGGSQDQSALPCPFLFYPAPTPTPPPTPPPYCRCWDYGRYLTKVLAFMWQPYLYFKEIVHLKIEKLKRKKQYLEGQWRRVLWALSTSKCDGTYLEGRRLLGGAEAVTSRRYLVAAPWSTQFCCPSKYLVLFWTFPDKV